MSLADKLGEGLFWDYCGSHTNSSRAVTWDPERIRTINAIQKLGSVSRKKGNAINRCTRSTLSYGFTPQSRSPNTVREAPANPLTVYMQLCENWTYYGIWWNSGDFALILACLLAGNTAARKCNALMRHLAALREFEVVEPRSRACERGSDAGGLGFIGAVALTVITGGATAPVTMPLALASWSAGAASTVASGELASAVELRRDKRERQRLKVQRRFVSSALNRLFS